MVTQTISHYEILERLGEGWMGTVYRAVDTRLGRPVAVKLLRRELAASGESKRRFVQEAKAASALNHPHITAGACRGGICIWGRRTSPSPATKSSSIWVSTPGTSG